MYSTRVDFALDQFIEENYFLPMHHQYHLKEEKDSGKSDLILNVTNDNLCIYNFDDKRRCGFLRPEKKYGMQKSVDHVLLEKTADSWKLHLIEMKSGVGYKTWLKSIKPKVRTSYFNILALAGFLGIRICEVIVYTTYEKERFLAEREVNPRMIMPQLGSEARDPFRDEWEKDRVILNVGEELVFSHKKVLMKKNALTGTLEGMLTI